METEINKYRELLRRHDWSFEFSEDPSTFRRGIEQLREIETIQSKIDNDYVIWNQYAPDFFKRGSYVAKNI